MLLPHRYRIRLPSHVWMVVAITAVAFVLRVAAGFGDLWLDEVWSIQLADQISAPWEILTRLRSDNNHMLNTAYVAWLGGDQPMLSYRLLSIVAGTLSVVVAGAIGAERGRVEQGTAMVVIATSFLMVQYSSEARGYALALLFALTAYWSLLRFLKQRRDRYALGFACCAAFGFLAHPTFLYFYVAACYWSVTVWPSSIRDWSQAIKPMTMLHALPGGVAVVLYLTNFRYLELGGGPEYDLARVLTESGSLAVGGPLLGVGAAAGVVVFVVAVIGSLWVLWRDGDDQWQVLAFCVVLPLVAAVATRTPFLFVRYFLIAIVFAQLVSAFGLAWLTRQGRLGKIAFAALLTLFIAANLFQLRSLYNSRRGHYQAALQFISDHDASETITIASNHDHGTAILVDFYRQRVSTPRAIAYCRAAAWPVQGPNWLILYHDPAIGPASYQASYVIEGQTYRLAKKFDASILSGWQWFCYRKDPQEALLAGKSSREMVNVAAVADR